MKWLERVATLYLYIGFWVVMFLAVVILMTFLLTGGQ